MNFYYPNPDGPANQTGSNIAALYKITTKNHEDENNDKSMKDGRLYWITFLLSQILILYSNVLLLPIYYILI
jgi:hypothetical protein